MEKEEKMKERNIVSEYRNILQTSIFFMISMVKGMLY